MWWRDDTEQDEAESLYKQILELESRIAKLVAHQVRVRRLLMQESSETTAEQIITLQAEVNHYLTLLRQERVEAVVRYDRLRFEQTLGRVRLAYEHERRSEEGW